MATAIPEISTGATITFSSSFFATAGNQITNISISDWARPAIDVAHFGTSAVKDFLAGDLTDPGAITVEFLLDATTTPPFAAIETTVITFPGVTGQIWTWTTAGDNKGAFLTDFSIDMPLEDVMTGSATLKLSGVVAITVTP